MDKSFYSYWGKARPQSENEAEYHLLPYHCLDVAAVGFEYLASNKALSRFFCEKLGCEQDGLLGWASFWLAMHDLGKFSEAFQSQKPEVFQQLQDREPNPEKPYSERHDSLGQWFWNDRLANTVIEQDWFGNAEKSGLDCWMRAVTGHHGQPPKTSLPNSPSKDYFSKGDCKAINEFVEKIQQLFLNEKSKAIASVANFEKLSQSLSWWFAGVAVLADWIGSNTDYFPYKAEEMPLDEYWQLARSQAKKALHESGVIPQAVKRELQFNDLFPAIEIPSPLQEWASHVEIINSPQIFLLEDVTGAGKTEAALALAYRLMEAGNADGIFVALPTMATANAMYQRMFDFYTKLFDGNANLVLAHGSRNLVDEFSKTIIHESAAENDDEQTDETATARCTAWLSDNNKRALLAQAGVGTIDQALLGVLHSKHQSLRLLGLFGKVLIVDEVHACDAYMQGVLKILLEFHAQAGGSVILLSATLPVQMKQDLLSAFAKGRASKCPVINNQAYPLATWWQSANAGILHEEALATRLAVTRTVNIHYQSEKNKVIDEISEALVNGQCVCWIRNTVADALEAYTLFDEKIGKENITLFHARFALNDRLNSEIKVLDSFGKNSTHEQRKGQLVIATQVIEQSLDVDFDFLVSDLAPIDRLVQRAGRLRRHIRDTSGNRLMSFNAVDQRGELVMMVFAPQWLEEPSAEWFKRFLPKAGFVYADHGQLWLTAKALQKGSFTMPDDARQLVEGVFGEDEAIPQGLQKSSLAVEGQQMADASQAKNNTLTFAAGYKRGDVMDWWSEAKTPSRLGEASINVVLAYWKNDQLLPWVKGRHGWAYSTVKIAERLISSEHINKKEEAEYQRVLETLPDKGKWSTLLPLRKNANGYWLAQAWSQATKHKPATLFSWQYDTESGLRLFEENNNEGDFE